MSSLAVGTSTSMTSLPFASFAFLAPPRSLVEPLSPLVPQPKSCKLPRIKYSVRWSSPERCRKKDLHIAYITKVKIGHISIMDISARHEETRTQNVDIGRKEEKVLTVVRRRSARTK
jgi:hypothetical protein